MSENDAHKIKKIHISKCKRPLPMCERIVTTYSVLTAQLTENTAQCSHTTEFQFSAFSAVIDARRLNYYYFLLSLGVIDKLRRERKSLKKNLISFVTAIDYY